MGLCGWFGLVGGALTTPPSMGGKLEVDVIVLVYIFMEEEGVKVSKILTEI